MSIESDAKEASILRLLDNYPNFKATDGFIDALLRGVEPYSARAVELACERFASGAVVGHDNRYVLNGSQLAEQARMFHEMYHCEVIPLHSGILEMDFGHGRVDMRGLTVEEQDQVIRRHGFSPDGRNLALLGLDEKRAALAQQAIEAPKATFRPRLKGM